jgi:hypothetical protein
MTKKPAKTEVCVSRLVPYLVMDEHQEQALSEIAYLLRIGTYWSSPFLLPPPSRVPTFDFFVANSISFFFTSLNFWNFFFSQICITFFVELNKSRIHEIKLIPVIWNILFSAKTPKILGLCVSVMNSLLDSEKFRKEISKEKAEFLISCLENFEDGQPGMKTRPKEGMRVDGRVGGGGKTGAGGRKREEGGGGRDEEGG